MVINRGSFTKLVYYHNLIMTFTHPNVQIRFNRSFKNHTDCSSGSNGTKKFPIKITVRTSKAYLMNALLLFQGDSFPFILLVRFHKSIRRYSFHYDVVQRFGLEIICLYHRRMKRKLLYYTCYDNLKGLLFIL